MSNYDLSPEALRARWGSTSERKGWDFSRIRVRKGPERWIYEDVVRNCVPRGTRVADIGTGGGERLLGLAPHFDHAIGIDLDPEMVDTAYHNLSSHRAQNRPEISVEFMVGSADETDLPECSFDAVLNRHSVVIPTEVDRILRPGGVFVTQQVGRRNLTKLLSRFGGQDFGDDQLPESIKEEFVGLSYEVLRFEEADYEYRYLDLDSALFQLKAIEHYLVKTSETPNFFELLSEMLIDVRIDDQFVSNEHRHLIVVRKPV